MIGHATLPFSFVSDGEHQFELRVWITETQTSNLLGIEIFSTKRFETAFQNTSNRTQKHSKCYLLW